MLRLVKKECAASNIFPANHTHWYSTIRWSSASSLMQIMVPRVISHKNNVKNVDFSESVDSTALRLKSLSDVCCKTSDWDWQIQRKAVNLVVFAHVTCQGYGQKGAACIALHAGWFSELSDSIIFLSLTHPHLQLVNNLMWSLLLFILPVWLYLPLNKI